MVQETHYGLLHHANSLLSTLWEHRYNPGPLSLVGSDFIFLPFSFFSPSLLLSLLFHAIQCKNSKAANLQYIIFNFSSVCLMPNSPEICNVIKYHCFQI